MVRRGASMRGAARRCGVSLCTVQRWVARAGGTRLDRVDFGGRAPGRQSAANRAGASVEAAVLRLRRELKERSDLGEFGAAAIRAEMLARHPGRVPSVRTIGRILLRRAMQRMRRGPRLSE